MYACLNCNRKQEDLEKTYTDEEHAHYKNAENAERNVIYKCVTAVYV